MWERHAHERVTGLGYQPIDPWNSCYFDPQRQLFLSVYVDDFKLARPSVHMKAAWRELSDLIEMDSPSKLGKYLGCEHEMSSKMVNG